MLPSFYVSLSLLWATLSLLNCAWGLHLEAAWGSPREPAASRYMSLISACTLCVLIACTGVAWMHHRKDSPRSQNPQFSFFWQGRWPLALREGWCLRCYFFSPLISAPLFPSSLSLCLEAHTPLALFSSKFYLPTQDFRIEFSWSSLGSLVLCRNILSYPTVLMGDK